MILSWSITEVIRYVYYALNLLGREPYALLYIRYTTFYVLYLRYIHHQIGITLPCVYLFWHHVNVTTYV